MARRFIVDEKDIEEIDETKITIFGNEVKHIQVLRHNINDEIIINEFICKILEMKKDSITLEKIAISPKIGEPNINLTLYIAMLKGEKMDLVIQKAVELGVKNITPFISKNVVVKLDDRAKVKRKEKYQKIANEACKQCGRSDLVNINDILEFNEILSSISKENIVIFAYEKEDNKSLKDILSTCDTFNVKNISVIVGAEGGFTEGEADSLKYTENVECVSLGSRILRAETAAINLVSIVMYELDK